jgi:hypothetical protein
MVPLLFFPAKKYYSCCPDANSMRFQKFTLLQLCLGSVDVCDARVQVKSRAADAHPSWLDSESQVRQRTFFALTTSSCGAMPDIS